MAHKAAGYTDVMTCAFTSEQAGEGIWVVTVLKGDVDQAMEFDAVSRESILTVDHIKIHSTKGRYREGRKNIYKGKAQILMDEESGLLYVQTEDPESDVRMDSKSGRIQVNIKKAGLSMIQAQCVN